MLQVGNLATAAHDRAHFGSWAIISAPLYLSFDLRDDVRMDRVWALITNRCCPFFVTPLSPLLPCPDHQQLY
jgi:hypothetical protein